MCVCVCVCACIKVKLNVVEKTPTLDMIRVARDSGYIETHTRILDNTQLLSVNMEGVMGANTQGSESKSEIRRGGRFAAFCQEATLYMQEFSPLSNRSKIFDSYFLLFWL